MNEWIMMDVNRMMNEWINKWWIWMNDDECMNDDE